MWLTKPTCDMRDVNSFNCIDLAKFIGCISVVAIHTNLLNDIYAPAGYIITQYLSRFTVPFFFMAGSFLLFRKTDIDNPETHVLLKHTKKIYILYLIWTVIYLPFICYSVLINKSGIVAGIKDQIWHFFYLGNATQLWYLNTTVLAMLFLILLLKMKLRKGLVIILGLFLYLFGLASSTYFFVIEALPDGSFFKAAFIAVKSFRFFPHRALEYGFFFVALGMLMARNKISFSKGKAIFMLALFSLLMLAECLILRTAGKASDSGYYIFVPPAVFMLLYVLAKTALPDKPVYIRLRLLSSLVFYTHIFIKIPLNRLLELCEARAGLPVNNSVVLFTLTTLLSLAVSECILRLSAGEKFEFLKVLYGAGRRGGKK